MKKRLISMLLVLVMMLGMLPATALAASSEAEALGEVSIYNGGQKLSYLSINGRVRELIYTYFNYVGANGKNKEIPAYSQVAAVEIHEEEFEKTPKRSIRRFLYK